MTERTPSWSDADLRAYLSGVSPPELRTAIDAALETDDALGERLMALDDFPRTVAKAFEPLLDLAPVAEMEEGLKTIEARAAARRDATHINRRWAASGMAAALAAAFGIGLLSGRGAVTPSRPDVKPGPPTPPPPAGPAPWFESVAAYVSLYSSETFDQNPLSQAARARSLAAVGDRTALELSGLARIPGLRLQRAELLQLGGKPLGQVAYLDAKDRPVAVCILLRPTPPGGFPPSPRRPEFKAVRAGGLQIVHWNVQPYGFLVIGPQSEEELADLAQQVARTIQRS
jgi:anti-sigma factor RsiW